MSIIHFWKDYLNERAGGRGGVCLLASMPVVLALVALVLLVIAERLSKIQDDRSAFKSLALSNLSNRQYAEAMIAAMRLGQDGKISLEGTLLEGKALIGQGKLRDAQRLLAYAAPDDRAGYAPAHVARAMVVLTAKPSQPTEAFNQVGYALQNDPENDDALELAAKFAAGRREWPAVLKYLDKLPIESRPDLMLMKASAARFSGMVDVSIGCGEKAEKALRAMKDLDEKTAATVNASIAISLCVQLKFEEALREVNKTSKVATSDSSQLLGNIYFSWTEYLKGLPGANRGRVLELIEKGLEVSAGNTDLLKSFLDECDHTIIDEEQRTELMQRTLGKGGIATSFLHYYLGLKAWRAGQRESARDHYELACKLNPNFSTLSNNLALTIAAVSDKEEDLHRTLTMMENLVKQEPDNPYFMDTKGHVLAKMGRAKEAVVELEKALPSIQGEDKAESLRLLADMYDKLGMRDLAAEHRSAASAMK